MIKRSIIFTIFFLITSISFAGVNKTVLPLSFDSSFAAPNYLAEIHNIEIGGKNIPLILDAGMGSGGAALYKDGDIKGQRYLTTNKKIHTVGVKGKHCTKIIVIPNLKIGDFEVKNVKGVICSRTLKECLPKYYVKHLKKTRALKNGVIGLALLQRFNLLVDYQQKKAVLYKHGIYPDIDLKKWRKISFDTKNGFIGTDAVIDGVHVRLAWDTDYAPSRIKPFASFKANVKKCPASYNAFGKNLFCYIPKQISISGTKMPSTLFLYKSLKLPDFVPIDGFIGANFFYHNAVFFDFKNNVMYIHHFRS